MKKKKEDLGFLFISKKKEDLKEEEVETFSDTRILNIGYLYL